MTSSDLAAAGGVTLIAALAVKQLAFALKDGSWFAPMRRGIAAGMRRRWWGFTTLNELVTCELCLTMQVSLWIILLPTVVFGHLSGHPLELILGTSMGPVEEWSAFLLAAFIFAMGVSGIALGLWRFLEYPARRYHALAMRVEELQQEVESLGRQGYVSSVAPSTSLAIEDFRELMTHVNAKCRGIGCGFSRRDCRMRNVGVWFGRWAEQHPEREPAARDMQRVLGSLLPNYFRDHSDNDVTIEDEDAFRRLYGVFTERMNMRRAA